MRALVLAAGKGSRLGELLGESLPKPLIDVGGMPVLERNLRWLCAFGITEIAINLHHLGAAIEARIGDGAALGMRVRYSRETELLGTAGALRPLTSFFGDEPFLVAYGDNLFDFDLGKMLADHRRHQAWATIALFSVDEHQHTGVAGGRVELDPDGQVRTFVEGARVPHLRLVNAACYVLEPLVLQRLPPVGPYDFGKDLFPALLREGGVLRGHIIDGRCLGLDTLQALAEARRLFAGG